jgi:putative glutamine amidotransferase
VKPLIGITGRQYCYGKVAGTPVPLAGAMVDAVMVDYVTAVAASGGLPVHLPIDADPVELVGRVDGVVLSGGADLEPGLYGAAVDPETGQWEENRDRFELAIARAAIARSAPTLGVCRGIQVLNVAVGGTLKQHVPAHAQYDSPPKDLVHDLDVKPGTVLHGLYGERHRVNSFHHQTVDRVGGDFIISARSEDGEIEAIELPGQPIIGIQWHPEMLQRREPAFDWLVGESCSSR